MANASLPGGGASDASRKVLPMKLVRDAVNSYRSVTQPLQVDSELEEDEDGLHIDFGDVSRTLLEACAESAKARRVDSDEKSSHSRRPPVFLDNYLLIEGHGVNCWMRVWNFSPLICPRVDRVRRNTKTSSWDSWLVDGSVH